MWNRGGVSSALERAQAQLSGRRLTQSAAKDDPDHYVAKGTSKTHGHPEYVDAITKRRNSSQDKLRQILDLSDLSLSSVDSDSEHPKEIIGKKRGIDNPQLEGLRAGGGSRFLKKDPPRESQPPALSRTLSVQPKYVTSSQRSSQSTALSRLALIENRIRNGSGTSDRTIPQATQERETTPSLSAQSSSELSMKGKRFLKKPKRASPTSGVAAPKEKGPYLHATPLGVSKAAAPVRESSGGVTLDSDEEDMRKLLGDYLGSSEDGLGQEARVSSSQKTARKLFIKSSQNSSPSSPLIPTGKHTLSPTLGHRPPSPPRHRSPRHFPSQVLAQCSPSLSAGSDSVVLSQTLSSPDASSPGRQSRQVRLSRSSLSALSEVHSLEELFPEDLPSDDAISEKSGISDVYSSSRHVVSAEYKMNIMSLDDLAPVGTVGKATSKMKAHRDPSPRSFMMESSTEEQVPSEEPMWDYESDFESEIRTETDRSSVCEISEHLGDRDEDVPEVSSAGENSMSVTSQRDSKRSGVSEGDSRVTHKDYSRTADSFSGRSTGGSSSRSSHSSSEADTITPSRACKRSSPSRRSFREAAVQTQPDGLTYTWSSGVATLGPAVGKSYEDPAPVAGHTVSAEALRALSTYSPAVFALNDMLRQQLSLTKHFVQTSRHLHSSLLQSLGPADHPYTTLEDTKEFIRCHKPPKLTMEEALEEVLQEMREYHYI
ncbi:uncharacterized protein C19orf44 homolog isoform X1 [Esox lucius]|uniref:uncharacterized protein C19orf44 homolog isoform X1 n=1 Tax=Esox lucius TaxID=8010 RepID=UPI001476DF2C|nr:uncharacterized protein C19orf44 homolog isoform X1 [Esox lucius]XP_034149523.1 uncharacterized protein C19orf44 homolog isoform X1 [Esox lucius]